MTVEALSDQVAGMLSRVEIPVQRGEDGELYVMRGSAIVWLTFHDQLGVPVVSASSPVIQGIDMSDKAGDALVTVNELNRNNYFAKFVLYPSDEEGRSAILRLEHDLLGTHLQTEELVGALDYLSRLADDLDDVLAAKLGGVSFEASMDGNTAIDT